MNSLFSNLSHKYCCDPNVFATIVFILKMFTLINNQLLKTANAKDFNTDYYITNSCLIKTGIMKMYGIGFFFFFFSDTLENFQKSGTNRKSGHSPVPAYSPILFFFYLTPLSTAFEKVCEVNFLPKFLNVLHFLKNLKWLVQIVGSSPV